MLKTGEAPLVSQFSSLSSKQSSEPIELTRNVKMHRSKKLAMIVSLTLPHFVMASTVTQFTSSMTGSLAAAQSSDCAAIVSSCPFAQTGKIIGFFKMTSY
jgi:hypothetical protein